MLIRFAMSQRVSFLFAVNIRIAESSWVFGCPGNTFVIVECVDVEDADKFNPTRASTSSSLPRRARTLQNEREIEALMEWEAVTLSMRAVLENGTLTVWV